MLAVWTQEAAGSCFLQLSAWVFGEECSVQVPQQLGDPPPNQRCVPAGGEQRWQGCREMLVSVLVSVS